MSQLTLSDGANLWFQREGRGQTILLVHGWSMSSRYWRHQTAHLAQSFEVLTVDLRGHGRSGSVAYGGRLSRLAMDIRELLLHLDTPRVHAVGWSMGAAVLLALHDLCGDRHFSSLTLVDQPPKLLNEDGWLNGVYHLTRAALTPLSQRVRHTRDAFMAEFIPTMFVQPPTAADLRSFIEDAAVGDPAFIADLFLDLNGQDWLDVLPRIRVRTHVMAGMRSAARAGVVAMHGRIANSRLSTFAGSAHCPFWDEPAAFNRALRDFIAKE